VYALDDRRIDGGIAVRPSRPPVNTTVELNVSEVVAAVGGPTKVDSVNWSFGDGGNASGISVFHEFTSPGSYDVTATVTTTDGFSFRLRRTVTAVDQDASAPRITLVAASPPGQVPGSAVINKTYTVGAVAPSGVERVRFEVLRAGEVVETLVDTDGSDGWRAPVPTTYGRDSVVRITAVAASGQTASRTLDIGVVSYGPFVEFILENGVVRSTTATRGVATQDLPSRRLVIGVALPPGIGQISVERDAALLGKYGFSYAGEAQLGARFSPTRYTLAGFTQGSIQSPAYFIAGKGSIRGVSREGVGSLEFERVEGTLEIGGGGYTALNERLPPSVPEVVDVVVFYGGFLTAQGTWRDGDWWPPEEGRVSLAGKVTGSTSAGIGSDRVPSYLELFAAEASAEGQVVLASDFPQLGRNAELSGEAKLRVRVVYAVATTTVEVTLFNETLVTAASGPRVRRTTELRRKTGTAPPSPAGLSDPSLAAASFDAVGTDTGRLTDDPYADGAPSVASTGDGFLVAWARQPATNTVLEGQEITVRRYADGSFGSPTNLTDDRRPDLRPSAAAGANGSRLVTWTRVNRTFEDPSAADPNASFAATEVALATQNASGGADWSAPRLVTGGSGAAFSPRVAYGDGRYLVAWRTDADGDRSTVADRNVRYATVDPATGTVGTVRTIRGGVLARVAGTESSLRLVAFRPGDEARDDGQLVVRDLAAGNETGPERTIAVENLSDLAATTRSITWLSGSATDRTLRYVAGNRSGTVDTGPVAVPTDLGAATRETAAGEPVSVVTFRGRTVEGNETSTPAVFYRVRHGGEWTAPRRVSPESDALTFGRAATGGGSDGFLTAFLGRNVSDDAQLNDVFFARHRYGAAPNLTARAVSSAAPGEEVTVRYAVTNEGGLTARNLSVVVSNGSRTLAERSLPALTPGERAAGAVTVTAPTDGEVTVRARTDAPTLPSANNTATAVTSRPNLTVAEVVRQPGARNVTYAVRVENGGEAPAPATRLVLTNGPRTVLSESLPRLAPGEDTTATLSVNVADLNRFQLTRIVVDPADAVAETNESDGTRLVRTTLPELSVADPRFVADGEAVEVTVGNRGPGAATVAVTAARGNRTATSRVEIGGNRSGAPVRRTVRVNVSGLDLAANETVYVRARPNAPERNTTDNLVVVTAPSSAPVVVPPDPAADPDGDGLYEDINGDGKVNFIDVIDLVFADKAAINSDPDRRAAADFSGDGRVSFLDVIDLVFEL
jgi:PKD repeat protein